MPTPSPSPAIANGDTMVAADIAFDLQDVRDYLNGGWVAADFGAAVLGIENVYRPDIRLTPRPWADGETQLLADAQRCQEVSTVPTFNVTEGRGVGQSRDRYNLYNKMQLTSGYLPIRGLGRRLPIEAPAHVSIAATFFGQVITGPSDGLAGYFRLRYRRVEDDLDGAGTTFVGSRRQSWILEERGYYVMFAGLDIEVSGTYDFFVIYDKSSALAVVQQVTVARQNLVVEVFKQPV